MTKQNSSHKLDEFGSIDYQKPLDRQQDMRTSTYLGHKLMDDNMLGNKVQVKYQTTKPYEEDSILEKQRTTDYRTNYVWKFGNPDEIRNISLNGKVIYMKPFYDCNLKFLKRPMLPASSVTHSDYLWQPQIPLLAPVRDRMPSAIISKKIVMDRNKPGYSKYLDPMATTTNLDYCYRSPKDVLGGIAAKDNITFWNWKDIEYRDKKVFPARDDQLCDKLPSNECIKRRGEFPSQVRAVPNSGLTTEVRENYVKPNERALVFDNSNIKSNLTFVASEPTMGKTEYSVFGSGQCTQAYV